MIEKKLYLIKHNIERACKIYQRKPQDVQIVAVSKTIASEKIITAINQGLNIFGENYIKEAKEKWPSLRQQFPNVKLHLVGHLQSNKVADALELFDCIHSLDSKKLAIEIAKYQKKLNKSIALFIQVNIGNEPQKHGIAITDLNEFVNFCRHDLQLNILGLMAITPAGENSSPYYALLKKLAIDNKLSQLSMGMSNDYEDAIALGANYIRLGTAIFGERNP